MHTWVDPRGTKSKEEWEWQELNAFHSADCAKQILEDMDGLIGQAVYIRKKERGEVDVDKFKKFWEISGQKETKSDKVES